MNVLRRRRPVLAAVAAAALLPLLAACGGGSGSSSEAGGLTLWHELAGSGNTAMNQVVADYNTAHPDAKIAPRQIADDQVDTVLRTGMSGNNPPDVLQYEGYQQTADYAKAGQLTDITAWWDKHKSAFSFADSTLVSSACSYEGKVYCVPWDLYTNNQLYYNADLAKKYGIQMPQSLDDLKTAATTLQGTGVSAVSMYGGDGWPAAQWWYLLSIQRCGAKTVEAAAAQKGATWDDACFQAAAQDLADLGKAGAFPQGVAGSDYNAQLSLFLSGKALFMMTGTWFEQTLAETPATFDVQTTPFPQADAAKPSQQLLGGVNEVFGIPARSKHQDQAYAFLDTLATKQSGEAFAKASVMNMVAGTDGSLPPRLQQTWQQATKAIGGTSGSQDNIVTYFENLVPPSVGADVMYNGSASVAAGSETPKKFVDDVQAAAASAAG